MVCKHGNGNGSALIGERAYGKSFEMICTWLDNAYEPLVNLTLGYR